MAGLSFMFAFVVLLCSFYILQTNGLPSGSRIKKVEEHLRNKRFFLSTAPIPVAVEKEEVINNPVENVEEVEKVVEENALDGEDQGIEKELVDVEKAVEENATDAVDQGMEKEVDVEKKIVDTGVMSAVEDDEIGETEGSDDEDEEEAESEGESSEAEEEETKEVKEDSIDESKCKSKKVKKEKSKRKKNQTKSKVIGKGGRGLKADS